MEGSACCHLGELSDEHGGIAGWKELEGDLQSKQTALCAICNQAQTH